jgi:3-hydroxyisobutyrate dehydrogenase-like beta-hydroxyacid dehydrogenase
MGRAFTDRALDQGHEVAVWNRSPGKAGELVERGARESGSPADAAKDAEVVLVVVSDDRAARAVCIGDSDESYAPVVDGLAETAVLANVSTVSPQTARHIAERGADGRVLDAPILGAPTAVREGKGRFLVGGPQAAYDAVRPLLNDLAADSVHCGPNGAGATVKLACNLLLISGVTALAEAIAIARGQGVDDDHLGAALDGSLVMSQAQALRLPALLDPEHPGWFGPALARKDVRLAADLADEAGVEARIARASVAALDAVADGEWPDFAAVIEGLRR